MAKILLVEDDLDLLKIYHDTLKKAGHLVFVTSRAEEGLHLAHTFSPELILLDIILSGKMNGFDLLEKLKASPKLSKIPVLVLTNLSTEHEVAKKIGATEYIVKANIKPDQLVEIVSKHIN